MDNNKNGGVVLVAGENTDGLDILDLHRPESNNRRHQASNYAEDRLQAGKDPAHLRRQRTGRWPMSVWLQYQTKMSTAYGPKIKKLTHPSIDKLYGLYWSFSILVPSSYHLPQYFLRILSPTTPHRILGWSFSLLSLYHALLLLGFLCPPLCFLCPSLCKEFCEQLIHYFKVFGGQFSLDILLYFVKGDLDTALGCPVDGIFLCENSNDAGAGFLEGTGLYKGQEAVLQIVNVGENIVILGFILKLAPLYSLFSVFS